MIDVLRPTSREEWLTIRRGMIGASEAGAVLGVHPFLSTFELWALKSGIVTADQTETLPMKRGRLLEKVACELIAEDRPDWALEPNPIPGGKMYRDTAARLSCTPDLFAVDPTRPGFGNIQIKSVELSRFRKDWRDDDGTPSPPLYAAIQAIIEAHLTGASWTAVAPLVVGFGIEISILDVPIHAGVVERIRAEVAAFWQRVADNDPPPPDYARDGKMIADLYREDNGREIDLSAENMLPELAVEDGRLAAEISERTERRKAIKAELLAKMGNAAVAIRNGKVFATAKTVNRAAYSVAAASYRNVRFKESYHG